MLMHNWLTGLGTPESGDQYKTLETDHNGIRDPKEIYSEGTLHILNSNFNRTAKVTFKDLFPTYLTALEFDATEGDIQYFTAEVTFKYTIYTIETEN